MSCKADVERRIRDAEGVISAGGKTAGLYDKIFDAIYQCPDLGNLAEKNSLMLKVDYHLDQFYRHAEPATKSLDEISRRPVPQAPKIVWREP